MASFGTFFHGEMSGTEITCIQSFLDHGHDVEIFAYGDCRAPGHFRITDAAKILKKRYLFRYRSGPGKGSVAAFANRFRYALMATTDLWWIDTDVICLRHDWPQRTALICAGWEDEQRIGTAILCLNRALAAQLYEDAAALGKRIAWGETGPDLLTRVVQRENLSAGILPRCTFYPLHYSEWKKVRMAEFREDLRAQSQSSHALHLWNEMGRRLRLDKRRLPDRESLLGSLVQLHGTANYFRSDEPAARQRSFTWQSVVSSLRL